MTVPGVNRPLPIVEGPAANQTDRHRSESPAQQTQTTSVRPPPPKNERGKLMAHIERGRKVSDAGKKESKAKTWNPGFSVACELVEAFSIDFSVARVLMKAFSTDKLASDLFPHVEKMPRPQASQPPVPSPRDLITNAVNWLRASGSPEQENGNVDTRNTPAPAGSNADLITKLESLKTDDNEDSNSLGFYAVMAVMSAIPRLTESILMDREGKVVEASAFVNQQVKDFTNGVEALLKQASPAPGSPLITELIQMTTAVMKVPYEYLSGKGMITNLTISLDKLRKDISKTEREASQTQLETALGNFIDALINLK